MKISRVALGLPLFVSALVFSMASMSHAEVNRALKGDRLDRVEKRVEQAEVPQAPQVAEKADKTLPVIQPQKPVASQILFDYQRQAQPHPQSQTKGVAVLDNCPDCQVKTAEMKNAEDIQRVIQLANAPRIKPQEPNMCVINKLIQAAKIIHKKNYRGRQNGRGYCGRAVRQSLTRAGFYAGGAIGHAKDMMAPIRRMGFKNILTPGMTPRSAPNGSILIYGAPKNKKGCGGLGTYYGHIEIKENNNSFLYDGNPNRNIQEKFGARCRPLIGVMMMGEDCPTCKPELKRACEI